MGEVVLSGLLSDMSGKLGDTITFRHRGHLLQKAWKKPSNPQTSYQTNVRNSFGSLLQMWGTLTDAQRFSWSFAASQIFLSNHLGVKIHPTGQMLFMRCNQNLFNCGLPSLNSFVSPVGFEYLLNPTAGMSYHTAVPFSSDMCKMLFSGQTTPSNIIYLIFASIGLSAGINNGKKYLRLFDAIPAGTSNEYDCTGTYFSRFYPGIVLLKLPKVFFKLTPIDTASGLSGQDLYFPFLVT